MSTRPAGALPYFALGFGVLGLGASAILVRLVGAPGAVSALYRVGIAAAVMTLPAILQARRRPPPSRRFLGLAILAGLFFAGDLTSWNTAVLTTNAATATLMANTSPLWVGLGALLLFREKHSPVFWGGLLVAMAGAAVILGGDFARHPTLGVGDLLGLLAGVFYGGYFLATQRAREGLSTLSAWWVSALASIGALLVFSLVLRQPLTGYPLATYLYLLAVALITQVGAYLAVSYALGHLPAAVVAPTLLGQPVLTALLAIPLLGEPLEAGQVAGGLLVLGGIWLVHRSAQPGDGSDGDRTKAP